ncbi:MAG: nucleoside-diphosphate kinase [Calditrichaeota bacterium]|nr:nucleoside-diphosphate kinase [Calditrichota bacterium]RQV92163.1 MAG: nucleoside-diphosphate kinase [bacterium]
MKERTLTIIKPECVSQKHIGDIIQRIEKAGFEILGIRMVHLSPEEAKQFYLVHKERPFYGDLVNYMSSGKVVVVVLEKENCVEAFRKFIGSTNPEEAEPGTIRKDFGTNIQNNCVHASDSPENARTEISFFFSQRDLILNQ